jgi:hypothetical protein
MRIFAIAQWHHFAYMMISIAMLGFGAGGTVLTLFRKRIAGRESAVLRMTAFSLTASLVASYSMSQKIPFEVYQLVSQPQQIWYLLGLYLVLAVPFFFASCAILLGFFLNPAHIGRVYGFNMLGSGVGATCVVWLLYLFKPSAIPYLLTVVAAAAFVLLVIDNYRHFVWGMTALGVFCAIALSLGKMPIRISEYKGLSYALRMPGAKVVAETQSPLSVITAVASSRIRETPGQISYQYSWRKQGALPEQVGLFFDGDSVSVVNRFEGNLSAFAYLDHVTSALPYHLLEASQSLVIGAGGGTDVLMALAHGVKQVTAVELDPRIFPMIRQHFRDFSGRLYERSDVTPVIAEGREFLQSSGRLYDMIHIPPIDSFSASSAGVYALNESYLYTTQALVLYLHHLTSQGVLAITRWLKTPPRDELKIFASLIEAAQKIGIENPARHLAFIRSWNTATLLISRSPLTERQIQKIRGFSRDRFFDVGYYPGIAAEETNRFTILEEPVYYDAAMAMLGGERGRFYQRYLFDIRPARDDRPYFFHFFKWSAFPKLVKGMGTEWIPFVEWGYLALVATILQAFVASLFLIFLPFAFAPYPSATTPNRVTGGGGGKSLPPFSREWKEKRNADFSKWWVFLYFGGIGFAYMFLEIAFIQKLMLFLAYPIYAVSVVLTSFLVFSGLGSYAADRIRNRKFAGVAVACTAILLLAVTYLVVLPIIFSYGARWSDGIKILASILLLAPLAFCMGIPFPSGMQVVCDKFLEYTAWAWAINGCASVLGAALATLIAIHFGFRIVVFSAVVMYGLALGSLGRLEPK